MINHSEGSIQKVVQDLAVNEAVFEIQGYLKDGSPKSMVRFVLGRFAEKHGVDAMEKVIEVMNLKEYLE